MDGGAMSIVFPVCSTQYIGVKGMMVECSFIVIISICYTIYWAYSEIVVDVLIGLVHIQIIETDKRLKPND